MKSDRVAGTALTTIDQHMKTSCIAGERVWILSLQVPLAAVPDLPLNLESGCSGRKLPTKGADPLVIKLATESSKVVLDVSGEQALP